MKGGVDEIGQSLGNSPSNSGASSGKDIMVLGRALPIANVVSLGLLGGTESRNWYLGG